MKLTHILRGAGPVAHYPTLVATGTAFEGNIQTAVGIQIDGVLIGNLQSDGRASAPLYIGEQGRVEGNVKGEHIIIAGTVQGNIHCEGRLELLAGAQVLGDIAYQQLSVQPTARTTGKLSHLEDANLTEASAS